MDIVGWSWHFANWVKVWHLMSHMHIKNKNRKNERKWKRIVCARVHIIQTRAIFAILPNVKFKAICHELRTREEWESGRERGRKSTIPLFIYTNKSHRNMPHTIHYIIWMFNELFTAKQAQWTALFLYTPFIFLLYSHSLSLFILHILYSEGLWEKNDLTNIIDTELVNEQCVKLNHIWLRFHITTSFWFFLSLSLSLLPLSTFSIQSTLHCDVMERVYPFIMRACMCLCAFWMTSNTNYYAESI